MGTKKDCEFLKGVTVNEEGNVIDVAKKLHKFQERRIFVLNKKRYPVGIISLVDINDRVVAEGRSLKKTLAKDIMSYPIEIVVDLKDISEKILKKMVLKDVFYAPVISNGRFKGILTYANLVRFLSKK